LLVVFLLVICCYLFCFNVSYHLLVICTVFAIIRYICFYCWLLIDIYLFYCSLLMYNYIFFVMYLLLVISCCWLLFASYFVLLLVINC